MGMAALKRLAWLAAAFLLVVAAVEALPGVLAWWRGEAPLTPAVWLGLGLIVAALALWWRQSVFAPGRGQCLLPEGRGEGKDGA